MTVKGERTLCMRRPPPTVCLTDMSYYMLNLLYFIRTHLGFVVELLKLLAYCRFQVFRVLEGQPGAKIQACKSIPKKTAGALWGSHTLEMRSLPQTVMTQLVLFRLRCSMLLW